MFEAFAAHEPVSLVEQHGADLVTYLGWLLVLSIGAIISLILWSIRGRLDSLNNVIVMVDKKLSDDVQLLRTNQETMWQQISETKARVNLTERDLAVLRSTCKIYNGIEKRGMPRPEHVDVELIEEDT